MIESRFYVQAEQATRPPCENCESSKGSEMCNSKVEHRSYTGYKIQFVLAVATECQRSVLGYGENSTRVEDLQTEKAKSRPLDWS